jgi:hypothetical protein
MEHAMSIERDHESERTSRIDRMVESLNQKPDESGRTQRRQSVRQAGLSDSLRRDVDDKAKE